MMEMVGGCCVCSEDVGFDENPLVYCDGAGCTVAVHQGCYGIEEVPPGPWYCRKCESGENPDCVKCELCPSQDGALKRTDLNTWAHVVCALYIPEVRFGSIKTMEPIFISLVKNKRKNKHCYICAEDCLGSRANVGACMQCNKQGCSKYFHVTCAQTKGLLCDVMTKQTVKTVKYCGYCRTHYEKLKRTSGIKIIRPYNATIQKRDNLVTGTSSVALDSEELQQVPTATVYEGTTKASQQSTKANSGVDTNLKHEKVSIFPVSKEQKSSRRLRIGLDSKTRFQFQPQQAALSLKHRRGRPLKLPKLGYVDLQDVNSNLRRIQKTSKRGRGGARGKRNTLFNIPNEMPELSPSVFNDHTKVYSVKKSVRNSRARKSAQKTSVDSTQPGSHLVSQMDSGKIGSASTAVFPEFMFGNGIKRSSVIYPLTKTTSKSKAGGSRKLTGRSDGLPTLRNSVLDHTHGTTFRGNSTSMPSTAPKLKTRPAEMIPHVLEVQKDLGTQFLQDQAKKFNVSESLLYLIQLNHENDAMEGYISLLKHKKELISKNARLSTPLGSMLSVESIVGGAKDPWSNSSKEGVPIESDPQPEQDQPLDMSATEGATPSAVNME